jgi:hypothetical protein
MKGEISRGIFSGAFKTGLGYCFRVGAVSHREATRRFDAFHYTLIVVNKTYSNPSATEQAIMSRSSNQLFNQLGSYKTSRSSWSRRGRHCS